MALDDIALFYFHLSKVCIERVDRQFFVILVIGVFDDYCVQKLFTIDARRDNTPIGDCINLLSSRSICTICKAPVLACMGTCRFKELFGHAQAVTNGKIESIRRWSIGIYEIIKNIQGSLDSGCGWRRDFPWFGS